MTHSDKVAQSTATLHSPETKKESHHRPATVLQKVNPSPHPNTSSLGWIFFLRMLLGLVYLVIPGIGWAAFILSFKRVNAGEIAAAKKLDGTVEILEEGFYFRPDIGICFTTNHPKTNEYIDFEGALQRVIINDNEEAVARFDGEFRHLLPGIHYINPSRNQFFDSRKGKSNINKDDYSLYCGETLVERVVRIHPGYLGESYDANGCLEVLNSGWHRLPAGHNFVNQASIADDVVKLGALTIVTIKTGQVGLVINNQKGYDLLQEGQHWVRQDQGCSFVESINTNTQLLPLDPSEVMCSDRINMRVEAVVCFRIIKPLLMAASTYNQVCKDLKQYAEGTLRNILRCHRSSDIAPGLPDQNGPSQANEAAQRTQHLKNIHEECVKQLEQIASGWGLGELTVEITHINPASAEYHHTLSNIGSQQAQAEAQKLVVKNEQEALATAAEGQRQRAIIEQETAVTAAATEAKQVCIRAQAELDAAKLQAAQKTTLADADAAVIQAISKATNFNYGEIADIATKNPTVANQLFALAWLNGWRKAMEGVQQPVVMPPAHLAETTAMFGPEGSSATLFATPGSGNSMAVATQVTALNALQQMQERSKRVVTV